MSHSSIKVIGKINIPVILQKKFVCDECGDSISPQLAHRVKCYDRSGKFLYTKYICDCCCQEQFGDDTPYSIFG